MSFWTKAALCVALCLVSACSTTRKIPEGEYLYTGLKGVDYTAPDSVRIPSGLKEVITEAVDVPGNKPTLFVLPAGL